MNPSESQRNQNNLGEKKAIKTAEIKKTNNRLKTPIISIKLRQRRKKKCCKISNSSKESGWICSRYHQLSQNSSSNGRDGGGGREIEKKSKEDGKLQRYPGNLKESYISSHQRNIQTQNRSRWKDAGVISGALEKEREGGRERKRKREKIQKIEEKTSPYARRLFLWFPPFSSSFMIVEICWYKVGSIAHWSVLWTRKGGKKSGW